MKKIFIVAIIIATGVFVSYFTGVGTRNAENNTNEKIEESSNKMEEIAELPLGKYSVREIQAPKGYLLNSPTIF